MLANKGNSVQTAEYAAARERRELQLLQEKKVQASMNPARRTSVGLRNALFDEIDALRRGDGDPERAIALSKIAATIIDTVRVEIQYRKSGLLDGPENALKLGSDSQEET